MASNLAATAHQAIMGLFRRNFLERDGAAVQLAPLASTDAANVEYLTDGGDYDLDLGDAPPLTARKGHLMHDLNFRNVQFSIQARDLGGFIIPQREISIYAATNGVDLVGVGGEQLVRRGVSMHAKDVLAAATASLSQHGTAIDLTSNTSNIDEELRAAQSAIELASGLRPDVIAVGVPALDKIANLVHILGGSSIAAGSAPVHASGSGSYEMARAWFRDSFGLELVVINSRQKSAAGVTEYQLSDEAILGYRGSGAEGAQSTLKTVYNPLGSLPAGIAADLRPLASVFSIAVRESAAPHRVGQSVTGEAFYQVHPMYPASGLRIPLTLSGS